MFVLYLLSLAEFLYASTYSMCGLIATLGKFLRQIYHIYCIYQIFVFFYVICLKITGHCDIRCPLEVVQYRQDLLGRLLLKKQGNTTFIEMTCPA